MSNITENTDRIGNFTSSEIWKLTKSDKSGKDFGTPALTYIQEKNIERRMLVGLKQDMSTKVTAWGHLMEMWVHQNYLSTEYESVGDITLSHPTIEFWKGSPDFKSVSLKIVAECKGYERKRFAEYADIIELNSVDALRQDFPEEYWQMVSNSIILGVDKIQPILFMPYESELADIKMFVEQYDMDDQWKYKYVYDSLNAQLPYLVDGGYYKNFNTCILDVPQSDKDFLTERVLLAGGKLNPFFINKLTTDANI